jgi:cholest-4-en-3-one 26-monooxygenase
MEILAYAMEMAEDRQANPRDDIVTKLVNAEIDGERLSSDEFGYFVLMLAVAGNETTRNAISHGMLAFFDNPDQWELFKAERPETAADEVIRWGTPVTVFQRTAVADAELGGQQVKKGQRLGLFYRSGNFDEDVFDHPERFDIRRDPNPHLGLGGFGAHYCLGASLAKLEIGLIFNAIADAMPDIRKAGQPERLRSGWLNGIKRLPVSYAASLSHYPERTRRRISQMILEDPRAHRTLLFRQEKIFQDHWRDGRQFCKRECVIRRYVRCERRCRRIRFTARAPL